jgi:hypothetical protein
LAGGSFQPSRVEDLLDGFIWMFKEKKFENEYLGYVVYFKKKN